MVNLQKIIKEALSDGFSQAGILNMSALELMPEVRDMCASDRCLSYNKNWTCPPACGTLEEAKLKVSKYKKGVLVQTIGNLEDDFDYESMLKTEEIHKNNLQRMSISLKERYPSMLTLGTGACEICKKCTYPSAPCRFPDNAIPSMEAFGLFVSKVCADSGLPYNNGPKTITYTSCFLFE